MNATQQVTVSYDDHLVTLYVNGAPVWTGSIEEWRRP